MLLNDISRTPWQRYIQQELEIGRSLRIITQEIQQSLLSELDLSEEQIQATHNTTVGLPVLTLPVSKGFQAFENLSMEHKKFLTKVVIYRSKKSLTVDIQQLTAAVSQAFDDKTATTTIQFFNEASVLMEEVDPDSMLQPQAEISQKISLVNQNLVKVRKNIKEAACLHGWDCLSFFAPQNVAD